MEWRLSDPAEEGRGEHPAVDGYDLLDPSLAVFQVLDSGVECNTYLFLVVIFSLLFPVEISKSLMFVCEC